MAKKENKLKGMKEGELKKELGSLQTALHDIKFRAQGSRSKNVKEAAALKRQIARVMTEMNKNNKK